MVCLACARLPRPFNLVLGKFMQLYLVVDSFLVRLNLVLGRLLLRLVLVLD